MEGPRLDDSGTQAQGRRRRAEVSTRSRSRPSSRRIDLSSTVWDNLRSTVEPRSGQHAEADADICGKGAARGTHAQMRPTLRLCDLGLVKSLQQRGTAVGTRTAQGIANYWARLEPLSPTQICSGGNEENESHLRLGGVSAVCCVCQATPCTPEHVSLQGNRLFSSKKGFLGRTVSRARATCETCQTTS